LRHQRTDIAPDQEAKKFRRMSVLVELARTHLPELAQPRLTAAVGSEAGAGRASGVTPLVEA
jgi:tagaturonate reductase